MKKFVSLLVCFALGCAVLAGCSKEIDDSETNLIISLYEGGYGTSAFQKIADKKEQRKGMISPRYPEYSPFKEESLTLHPDRRG